MLIDHVERFVQFVKGRCKDENINFVFSPEKFLTTNCGIECNGYFDGATLAVAAGKERDKWLKTLVHEYAHMTQYLDQTPAWVASSEPVDAEEMVEMWYKRELEFTPKQKAKWIGLGRDVELEAEKRTIQLIKVHSLPIFPAGYTKHANAYLYFWTYTGKSRRWYEIGKEPYNIAAIVDAMPDTFDNNYAVLPKKYERLYAKHC